MSHGERKDGILPSSRSGCALRSNKGRVCLGWNWKFQSRAWSCSFLAWYCSSSRVGIPLPFPALPRSLGSLLPTEESTLVLGSLLCADDCPSKLLHLPELLPAPLTSLITSVRYLVPGSLRSACLVPPPLFSHLLNSLGLDPAIHDPYVRDPIFDSSLATGAKQLTEVWPILPQP